MTAPKSQYERARHANGGHTGLVDRVREELRREPGTVYAISYRLGVPTDKVRDCVSQLCEVTGGFAPVPWSPYRARVYATVEWIAAERERLGKPAPTRSGSGVIAGRITVGRGSLWGSGLV